jgi:hypothetical protein
LLLLLDGLLRLISASAAEHTGEGVAGDMTDGRPDGHTSGCGGHLLIDIRLINNCKSSSETHCDS